MWDNCYCRTQKDMISPQALVEFKTIWKKNYGEDISDQTALDKATRLLTLMKVVYRYAAEKELVKDAVTHEEKRD